MLPPYVRAVRSVCWAPEGSGGQIVHALKYNGWQRTAAGMAERMARLSWPEDVVRERTALIPVPLNKTRERERGYNQSSLLALELSSRWARPVWNRTLVRAKVTHTQTDLTPAERARNVAGAFEICDLIRARELRGAHIMLVDDVVTTAATLNACAEALYQAGARIISYITFGRARA